MRNSFFAPDFPGAICFDLAKRSQRSALLLSLKAARKQLSKCIRA